jgi:hypothetical protein
LKGKTEFSIERDFVSLLSFQNIWTLTYFQIFY